MNEELDIRAKQDKASDAILDLWVCLLCVKQERETLTNGQAGELRETIAGMLNTLNKCKKLCDELEKI